MIFYKFSRRVTYFFVFMLAISISGCGGGSSDTSSSSTQNTLPSTNNVEEPLVSAIQYKDLFKLIDTQSDQTALIMDAYGVEGLHIVCSSTNVLSKKNGLFKCNGIPLNIYLGNFKIGTISKLPTDKIIYTQDILNLPRAATVHPDVTKLSMILQSLDENGNLDDGINITQESMELLDNELANFTSLQKMTLNNVNNAINNVIEARKANDVNIKLIKVSPKDAQINLTNALANTPPKG